MALQQASSPPESDSIDQHGSCHALQVCRCHVMPQQKALLPVDLAVEGLEAARAGDQVPQSRELLQLERRVDQPLD